MCKQGKMPILRERLNQLISNENAAFSAFLHNPERKNTDPSIVAFAEFLGTSRQSLGYYLNGERIPDAAMIKKICERCEVSADWLLGLSDVKTPSTDIQAIALRTGLSEKAIKTLERYKTSKLEINNKLYSINELLSSNYGNEVLNYIDVYLLTDFGTPYAWADQNDISQLTSTAIFFHKRNSDEIHLGLNTNMLENAVLDMIRDNLKQLRRELVKGENENAQP